MNLVVKFMTQNDCYKQGRKIKPQGIIVHSTATPGVMAAKWYDLWNKSGVDKCVHAFVDDKGVYQYLPWDMRGWHAGGKANDTHIGFEICEPQDLDDKEYFKKAWGNAIELAVFLCKEFNLTEKDILGHYEAHKKGIASNHADPGHWFTKHGKSMDDFRAEVKKALETPDVLYYVQTGAYRGKDNADKQYYAVRAKGFDAIIKKSGDLYKVQVGAFANRGNAEAMAGKVKAAGFDVYITTEGGILVPAGDVSRTAQRTQSKTIKVGSKVKIKPGAKAYDGKGLADFVYKTVYDVIQIDGNRVVIGRGKAVTAAVRREDLILL
jgi:N-acetylmuramoyl-L-alanine amidase CwlA